MGFSDPESGIGGYEWAIGTAPGSVDVQAFTAVGLATSATNSSLSLTNGATYFVTVRATNGVGVATNSSSDGVAVALPVIGVSPASLSFTAVEGSANPASQTFTVTNTGPAGSTLDWIATWAEAWLTVTPTSDALASGASSTVTASVNITGLAAGVYSATITVSDPLAANTPQTIPVSLTVLPKPAIALSPTSLAFSAIAGGASPAGKTFDVINSGPAGSTLNWTATWAEAWLTITLASGTLASGAATTATASVNISGLGVGSYSSTVTVADAMAMNTPQTLTVTLVISAAPAPAIGLSTGTLSFSGTQGGTSPPSKTFAVSNSGAGGTTLNWNATWGEAWMSVFPTPGSLGTGVSTNVGVGVDLTGLAAGTYSGTITLTAAGASNSPQAVSVTLIVSPPGPAIGVSPASLTFSAVQGGAPPSAQSVSVSNSGAVGSTLSWNATWGEAWLSAAPAFGTLPSGASTSLSVAVNPAGLTSGTYAGTITISDPAAGNSPQTVAVTLTVGLDPTLAEIDQFHLDAATPIGLGGFTNETGFIAKARVAATGGATAGLRVEVKPVGTAFDGTGTDDSPLVASGSVAAVTVQPLGDGPYQWRARAIDSAGATSAWTSFGGNGEAEPDFAVDTTAPTVPPISASPPNGTAPLTVDFRVAASDVGGVAFYQWDFDGDGAVDYTSSRSGDVVQTYAFPGTFTATLTVTDVAGNTTTSTVTIAVAAPPAGGLTLSATGTSGTAPLAVTFTLAGAPADAQGVAWDFDGNGKFDASGAAMSATYTYYAPGTFSPVARLVKADGTTTLVTGPAITVAAPSGPLPTTALITRVFVDADGDGAHGPADTLLAEDAAGLSSGTTVDVQVGERVGFEGAPDPAFPTFGEFFFDFTGDGDFDASGTSAPIHGFVTYDTPGTRTVVLRIRYDAVAREASIRVEVAPPTEGAPRVFIVQPRTGMSVSGDAVTFNVNAVPATRFNMTSLRLEAQVGGNWTDLSAFTTGPLVAPPAGFLRLDVAGAIAAGTLPAGTATPFRAVATTTDGEVIPSTGGPGSQGQVLVTPLASGGELDEWGTTNTGQRFALSPDQGAVVHLSNFMEIRLPRGTVSRPGLTLVVQAPSPAGFPAIATHITPGWIRAQIMIVDGGGTPVPPERPADVGGRTDPEGNTYDDSGSLPKAAVSARAAISLSEEEIARTSGSGSWSVLQDIGRAIADGQIRGSTLSFSYFVWGRVGSPSAPPSGTTGGALDGSAGKSNCLGTLAAPGRGAARGLLAALLAMAIAAAATRGRTRASAA